MSLRVTIHDGSSKFERKYNLVNITRIMGMSHLLIHSTYHEMLLYTQCTSLASGLLISYESRTLESLKRTLKKFSTSFSQTTSSTGYFHYVNSS